MLERDLGCLAFSISCCCVTQTRKNSQYLRTEFLTCLIIYFFLHKAATTSLFCSRVFTLQDMFVLIFTAMAVKSFTGLHTSVSSSEPCLGKTNKYLLFTGLYCYRLRKFWPLQTGQMLCQQKQGRLPNIVVLTYLNFSLGEREMMLFGMRW